MCHGIREQGLSVNRLVSNLVYTECAKPRQLDATKENKRNIWLKGPLATDSLLTLERTTMSPPPLREKIALAGSGWSVLFPSSMGASSSGAVVTSPTRMFSLENEVKKRTAPEKQIHPSFTPRDCPKMRYSTTDGNLEPQAVYVDDLPPRPQESDGFLLAQNHGLRVNVAGLRYQWSHIPCSSARLPLLMLITRYD